MVFPPAGIFAPERRALTLGIVLGITLSAFEALAVVTVAPRMAAVLGGSALYGWIFSGFLLASLVGTVVAGEQADRFGAGKIVVGAMVLFAAGLLVAGLTPNMLILILGRMLQGLGSGALITAIYAVANEAYGDRERASLFAVMSGAWVVPALIGPLLASLIAQALGWRAVFWSLLPLLFVAGVLMQRAFTASGDRGAKKTAAPRIAQALRLAGVSGVFLWLLTQASSVALLLSLLAGFFTLYYLRPLMPTGFLRAQPGLPALVAARLCFHAGFIGVEAFVAYMLTQVHQLPEVRVGVVIAAGSLSWAAGAFMQSRWDKVYASLRARSSRVQAGTVIVVLGLVVQLVALFIPVGTMVVCTLGWMCAGFGVGMTHSGSSVLAFALAPEGEGGAVASYLQLADQFGAAVVSGIGGALLALSLRLEVGTLWGVAWAFIFAVGVASLAVGSSRRILAPRAKGKLST